MKNTSGVITKKGRRVAKLVPTGAPATDVIGCMVGTARIVGDVEAPLATVAAGAATAPGKRTHRPRRTRPRRKPR